MAREEKYAKHGRIRVQFHFAELSTRRAMAKPEAMPWIWFAVDALFGCISVKPLIWVIF